MRPPLIVYALLALAAITAACGSSPIRVLTQAEAASEWDHFNQRWRDRQQTGKGY